MASFTTILCFAWAFVTLAHAVHPDLKEKVMKSIEECKKNYNVEQGLIEKVMKHLALPETEDGKCLLACTLKNLELIKDNKYNWERSLAMNKLKFDTPEEIERANEVVKKCGGTVPTDITNDCQLAYEISKCVAKEAKEANLTPPKWD